jgi:2-desacetyl-2-hydroxyethyl bacteriochlorophyllide A dehydrogenase
MDWPNEGMSAVVMAEPNVIVREERDIPAPLPGHVLVRTAYVGLCGTDTDLLKGTSFFIRAGLTRFPFVPGHEYSGTIVAVGPGVARFEPGDRVVGDPFITCGACRMCRRGRRNLCENRFEMGVRGNYDGAAADYARVPERNLVRLPDNLPLREAPFIESSVTVMSGFQRTRCQFDDRVAVIGTGTLGLVAVQMARALGAQVDAIGVEDDGLARALGASAAKRPEDAERNAYSVVIEASGSAQAAALVPTLLEPAGRAALLGIATGPTSGYDLPQLVTKDAEIHGILGGVGQFERTVELFAAGAVQVAGLIDRVVPSTTAADAYDVLLAGARARPKVLIEFDAAS